MEKMVESLLLLLAGKIIDKIVSSITGEICQSENTILSKIKALDDRILELEQLRKLKCWDCPTRESAVVPDLN
jgi:hypothetical protein